MYTFTGELMQLNIRIIIQEFNEGTWDYWIVYIYKKNHTFVILYFAQKSNFM